MPIRSPWGPYLATHRKMLGLSQQELAERLHITSATLSRWESGRQIPDFQNQRKLMEVFKSSDLMTLAYWIERVRRSHNIEFIVDPIDRIISGSPSLTECWAQLNPDFTSRPWSEFLPDGGQEFRRALTENGLKSLSDAFFGMKATQIHIVMDFSVGSQRVTREYDVWPIVTADGGRLIHFTGHDVPSEGPPPPSFQVKEFRVVWPQPSVRKQSNW